MIEDDILQMLMGTDRPLRTGEIAERLGVSKPTVVHHLKRLRGEGKVEQVLYQNVPSWHPSREWSGVLQRAKKLEQRLRAMYGENEFNPVEARDRLKGEFDPTKFDALLEIVPNIKPPVSELKVTRRIGCTLKEEVQAKQESDASQLAARAFTIIKRAARKHPVITDIIQRRRAIFNKRLNFWFLGDIPPPLPPLPPVSPDSAIELMDKNVETSTEHKKVVKEILMEKDFSNQRRTRVLNSQQRKEESVSLEEVKAELDRRYEALRCKQAFKNAVEALNLKG